MFIVTEKAPTNGYIFPLWDSRGVRATAHAYMKREKVDSIENDNGRWYTLKQIEEAMLN